MTVKDCSNCKSHTWGNEWWNCPPECIRCKYTDVKGEKVPSNWNPMPQTNADRIRAMSGEELISFFFLEDKCPPNISRRECHASESCKDCWVHWLKQPAEEEAQQDCTYNKNGHCMGQKMMPDCDPKNCDRKKD